MRRRVAATVLVAAAAIAVFPAHSTADGGPIAGGDAGIRGVTVPGSDSRYIATFAGNGEFVARISKHGGQVLSSTRLRRFLTVPSVALDQSATGLSADGGTLVLANPHYGLVRKSVFAILSAKNLRVRRLIELRGNFTLDGLSPDGKTLYLVSYRRSGYPLDYSLHSFDVAANRLDPDPIVDPRNPGEKMTGLPLTRSTSADGVWNYTLYDGGKERFVHALNTRAGRAYCIDLDDLPTHLRMDRLRLHLSSDGGTLTVAGPQRALAEIDTESLRVSEPDESSGGDISGWLALAGAGLLAAVAAIGIRRLVRKRRRLAPT